MPTGVQLEHSNYAHIAVLSMHPFCTTTSAIGELLFKKPNLFQLLMTGPFSVLNYENYYYYWPRKKSSIWKQSKPLKILKFLNKLWYILMMEYKSWKLFLQNAYGSKIMLTKVDTLCSQEAGMSFIEHLLVAHTLLGAFVIQFSQPSITLENRNYFHFAHKGTEAKKKLRIYPRSCGQSATP